MDEVRNIILKVGVGCLVMVLCVSFVDSKLSDYITICKAKDPELEKCLMASGQKLFQQMEKGIPEFEIKPVDPMSVPRLGIQRSDIGMSLVLSNSTHRGLSKSKISKAIADPEKQYFEFQLDIPEYVISGQYDVNGKVMLLPIKGRGESTISLMDLKAVWKLQGELVKRGEEEFMKVKSFSATIDPQLMKLHFDNLFNGNKLLGDTMNELLNTHWQEIFRRIKPALEKSYSDLLIVFAEKIFSRTPYNQIFEQ